MPEPERVNGFVGLTEDHDLIHNGERGQFVVMGRGDGTVLRVPHEPTDGDRERLRELNEQLRRAL